MQIDHLATLLFFLALMHCFSVSIFGKLAHRFEKGSASEAFFHLLSEVEIVFGFWAFVFLTIWFLIDGSAPVIKHQDSLNMTEPLFIFCIMILASTRPIVTLARIAILKISNIFSSVITRFIPLDKKIIQFYCLMFFGPLLGSLITEPAAITLVALLLYRMIDPKVSEKFLYGILALLFVNISIGGGLTHFAAPPILIVANAWGWGLTDVFINLGEPVLLAIFLNTTLFTVFFRKQIVSELNQIDADNYPMPAWVIISHLFFLVLIVMMAHHVQVFMGLFLIFIGLTTVTKNYQDGLKFKEGLLVAFFLAGLIVFGPFQKWWLEPILTAISETTLYIAGTALTAITDNAALTYLGSQVPTLSEASKWALVSGAITGGGLSILANAPNPAGFSILSSRFPDQTLNAFKLFKAAAPLTLIVMACFLLIGRF
jgi:hypothetical protein